MSAPAAAAIEGTDALRALSLELDAAFATLDPEGRLRLLAERVPGRTVFTTSLGIEDQMLTHLVFRAKLPIEVVTLDTGRLFPETYALWQRTEEQYGRRIKAKYPQADALEALIDDQGINGFYFAPEMRKACCGVRKVEPLGRALAGASGWVTGLRRDQSPNREKLDFVEFDEARGMVKANPLFDWTREEIRVFTAENGVPVNELHDKGFLSIGCAPCTRAIRPGEVERAGRWWWEEETLRECGLHMDASGRSVRARDGKPAPGDSAFETIPS
ncbi:phosphoadenosine phosphosulfate reductase [Aureimonas jatrophae]|uniref:Adenosine 5'-phosphosulfate reductase n=1 Tax=Aureimonas jatrophae TaxID=1166073 RepID=A0A1H0JZI4_9HYPH|nr:phosphoadenylyl-sulfate reductase [Aureimonas jatrophae]MBB3950869.1 phosphoadenosine phosphosulfate reductase [Aureimonas jatrophae]SDO48902.1 phosphoadenosine phosphosulfate reductase [Aureimonas jatrophae]